MVIPSLAYLERFRNEGTRTYGNHSDYSEAEPIYQPACTTSTFSLPVFSVPRQHLKIYTANPAADLASRYLSDEHALFCVHPQVLSTCYDDRYLQMITRAGQRAPELVVEPSSSTRTLLARDQIPHTFSRSP